MRSNNVNLYYGVLCCEKRTLGAYQWPVRSRLWHLFYFYVREAGTHTQKIEEFECF
jgi:hypothetical protein